jgi:hypothetical protein
MSALIGKSVAWHQFSKSPAGSKNTLPRGRAADSSLEPSRGTVAPQPEAVERSHRRCIRNRDGLRFQACPGPARLYP